MSNYLQIFISLFSILNPFLAISIYVNITKGLNKSEKRSVSIICGISVFIILAFFLFLGQLIMDALGIHEYSLRLAGGLIVLLIGIPMIIKSNDALDKSTDVNNKTNSQRIKSLGISPLALPMIVGPGSIVMVILYGHQESNIFGKFIILGILAIVGTSVIIVLFLADYFAKILGDLGITVLTKVMGLIIAAIACEMITSGITEIIPILANTLHQ